jgi:hypothetical protein
MGLKNDITNAMNENTVNTRLNNIADMVGKTEDEVRDKMKALDFRDYVDLMRALRDFDKDTAERVLGFDDDVEEAYSQGSTVSPSEMRAAKSGQQAPQDSAPSKAQKTQAMSRLGTKNLGGATASQAADALSKAGEGKPLTPVQRKAMASQAASVDALAGDPRTATQFRNLLNKLNKK